MASLSIESLFESAVKLFLFEDNAITITYSKDGIQVRFPTTRRLAEYLKVPHYYILPYFAMMEEQKLVTRAERVGILTTNSGTQKIISIMAEFYPKESSSLIGSCLFEDIEKRLKPEE